MSSSVPAVIPAFLSLAQGALTAGAQVWFGSVAPVFQSTSGSVSGVTSGITLQVSGVHFDEDTFGEIGPNYRHEEHYNIVGCVIASGNGPPETINATLLQDAYTEYNNLTVAVSNNPTLGLPTPAPRLAWPRQLGVVPTPAANGMPMVQIQFEIQVQARVNSLT